MYWTVMSLMKQTSGCRGVAAIVAAWLVILASAPSGVVAKTTEPSSGSILRIALIACHKLAGQGQILCYEPSLDKRTVLEYQGDTGVSVAFVDFSDKRVGVVPEVSVTTKDLSLDEASRREAPQPSRQPVTFSGRWLRVVLAACNQLALTSQLICEEPRTDGYAISVTDRLLMYDVAFGSPAHTFHISLSRAMFPPANLMTSGPLIKNQ